MLTNQLDTIAHAKEKLVDLSLQYVPALLAPALIIVPGLFLARWVARILQRWNDKL